MARVSSTFKFNDGTQIHEFPVTENSIQSDIPDSVNSVEFGNGFLPIDDPANTDNPYRIQTPSGVKSPRRDTWNYSSFYDDFEDGNLTSNRATFGELHPTYDIRQEYDFGFVYNSNGNKVSNTRTAWTVNTGSPSVSNGQLVMGSNSAQITTTIDRPDVFLSLGYVQPSNSVSDSLTVRAEFNNGYYWESTIDFGSGGSDYAALDIFVQDDDGNTKSGTGTFSSTEGNINSIETWIGESFGDYTFYLYMNGSIRTSVDANGDTLNTPPLGSTNPMTIELISNNASNVNIEYFMGT